MDLKQPAGQNIDPIIDQNIEKILAFHLREERNLTRFQRTLEAISSTFGQPLALGISVFFVVAWIMQNVLANKFGSM